MDYRIWISLHILAATIWTGGHLVLFFGPMLAALKARRVEPILEFERRYEKIGMPALAVLLVSGLVMAHQQIGAGAWFSWATPISRTVTIKLSLLALTVLMAISARTRVIPNLTPQRLPEMALHISVVTLASVLFVLTGVLYRYGGIV